MFLAVKSALKKMLGSQNVHFLILDKEMVSHFKNEKGLMQSLKLDHDTLELVVFETTSHNSITI